MKTYNVIKQNGILLNANESYYNVSDEILQEILMAIKDIAFHRYPEDSNALLCESYSKYVKLEKSQIMAGNGSDELLGLMIGLTIKKGKKLYTMAPDFSMYDYYVSMHEGEVITYKNGAEDVFDVTQFIEKGKKEKVDMILFSNPNNPTGKSLTEQEIITIIEAFKDKVIIVDEAYGEFNDVSMIPYVNTYKNLFVTRTLSKAFGMAGIRCGFLMGNKESMEKVIPYKVPYNVNTLTQCVGSIILNHVEEIKENINEIKKERDLLYQEYQKLNKEDLKLYPSKANYLYGKTTRFTDLKNAFEKENIQIRYYQNNSFRITISSKEVNINVLHVLKTF